jgi:hypothetical protein
MKKLIRENYKWDPDTISCLQGKNLSFICGNSLEAMFGNTPDFICIQLYFFYKAAGSYWIYNNSSLQRNALLTAK